MSGCTQVDAELILKLYSLRQEATLRRARRFLLAEFWPSSLEEIQLVFDDFGSERNQWLRQALSYWDMAASFVNRGVLHPDLFLDSAGECLFFYAKLSPFLPALHAQGLRAFVQVDQFIKSNDRARTMLAQVEKVVAKRRQNRAVIEHSSARQPD